MKYLASLAVLFASALAVEAGQPVSARSLNAIGLPGMKAMKDTQGHNVRAKFAIVWGQSTATAVSGSSGATSTNGYAAFGFGGHAGVNVSAAYANGSGFFAGPAVAVAGGFSAAN